MRIEPEAGSRERMREGIRARVAAWSGGARRGVRHVAAVGIVAGLVAGALAPLALAFAPAGTSALVGALAGQAGGLGANYLADVAARAVRRLRGRRPSTEQVREALEAELLARLDSESETAASLRAEIAELLRSTGGVEVAVGEAVRLGDEDLQRTLTTAFGDLGRTFTEFRWMVGDLRQAVTAIHQEVASQGAEQRRQTDLLRRTLLAVTALRDLTAPPLERGLTPGGVQVQPSAGWTEPPAPALPGGPDERCPYQGLARFEPEDADRFFGRERLTHELVTRLAERVSSGGVLLVVGPSGSGKSSLLRAGLVPALVRGLLPVAGSDAWPWLVLTPTGRPITELALRVAGMAEISAGSVRDDLLAAPERFPLVVRQALAAAGRRGPEVPQRLVLVVDQFEEVFTLCEDEGERRALVSALCAAAGPGPEAHALVILGLRSDFYARCSAYPALLAGLQDNQTVGPMSTGELRRAIEEPARGAGLALEPGLVELLLGDLGARPDRPDGGRPAGAHDAGALPLLSHALYTTWQHRHGALLTRAAYQDRGGIRGAVARTAESIYLGLDGGGQDELRRLLLRLVAVGEDLEDTRRRVRRDELLDGARPGVTEVLARLVAERLVTVSGDMVEITHEALLDAWPRLGEWLGEDRRGLRLHRQLTLDARAWAALGRDPGAVYRGARFTAAREWATDPRHHADLSPLEWEFLNAGIGEFERVQRTERSATRRRRRRVRALVAALVAIAVTAGVAALGQSRDADQQRRRAAALSLVHQAETLRESHPRVSLLLAVAAQRVAPIPEARSELLSALGGTRYAGTLAEHSGNVTAAAFSPDGRTLATAGRSDVILWSVGDRSPPIRKGGISARRAERSFGGGVVGMAFGSAGKILAIGGSDGLVTLWDVSDVTNPHLAATVGGASIFVTGVAVAFSRDGRTLAAAAYNDVVLWDVTDPASPHRLTSVRAGTNGLNAVALSADGHTVAAAGYDMLTTVWDVGEYQRPVQLAALGGHTRNVNALAFSPDDRSLLTGSWDGTAVVWDFADRARPVRLATLPTASGGIDGVAFSRDGHTIAAAGGDHRTTLWDASDRGHPVLLATLPEEQPALETSGFSSGVAFSPVRDILATALDRPVASLWRVTDLTHPQPVAMLDGHVEESHPAGLAFAQDAPVLAAATAGGVVGLWNLSDPARPTAVARLPKPSGAGSGVAGVGFTRGGGTVAVASLEGPAVLWRLADPAHPVETDLAGVLAQGLALSPDGLTLVTTMSGSAVIWDVSDPSRPRSLDTLTRDPKSKGYGGRGGAAFSPDGRTLAFAPDDHPAVLYDVSNLASTKRLAALPGVGNGYRVIAFSPDGRTLVTGGSDHDLTVWDVSDRTHPVEIVSLTGHTSGIASVAFSRDGRLLATGSIDRTAILYDMTDRDHPTTVATLSTGADEVLGVAFSPDGRTLATATSGHTAVIWDVSELADVVTHLTARACAVAGPDLDRGEWSRYAPGLPYQHSCRAGNR